MTDFCQSFSLSRLSETLDGRVFHDPTLRNLTVPCMGLLRFSIFDAVEKSVQYQTRAIYYIFNPCSYFSLFILMGCQIYYIPCQGIAVFVCHADSESVAAFA